MILLWKLFLIVKIFFINFFCGGGYDVEWGIIEKNVRDMNKLLRSID